MFPILRHVPFRLYFLSRGFSEFAAQMSTVAIGWQIYAMTNSAFALGMVGLTQFLPTLLFVFLAGHIADKHNRKRIVQICLTIELCAAGFLAWGSMAGWLTVPEIFATVAVLGASNAFENPARAALLPAVVPEGLFQKATSFSSGVYQFAVICGPAFGGFVYALRPGATYAVMMGIILISIALMRLVQPRNIAIERREPPSLARMFDGVHFVRSHPAILGTISLDLFAVLLGGATALLPIYAKDILHTGPWGLGVLRGAPAVGALLMALVFAHYSLKRRVGLRMFQAVIVFGVGTVVFALSKMIWLSLAALFVMGAADMVSVVIRTSLVQLQTPDEMRGRVSAVNFLFVHASNQLGEFESGTVAALIGAMPAAVVGGLGTIMIALLWMKMFPALRKLERLEG